MELDQEPREEADRRRLQVVPGRYAVCRLDPAAAIPAELLDAPAVLVVVTRTAEELSIVCPETSAPAGARVEPGWIAFKLAGPIPFDEVGVLAGLCGPLAAAGVGVFAVSTYDTDYLLVKAEDMIATRAALSEAGYEIDGVGDKSGGNDPRSSARGEGREISGGLA